MPFSIIPFLLLFIPILEIAVFVLVGGQIGVILTLTMILVTAIIGTILLRVQGISILSKIQNETNAGRVPGRELGNGAMIMVAGVLLLTPGFVTDSLGFLLFVPPIRDLIWKFLASKVSMGVGSFSQSFGGDGGFGGFGSKSHPHDDSVVDLDPDEYDTEDFNPENDDLPKVELENLSTKKDHGAAEKWGRFKD